MLLFARALKDRGTPIPGIAKKLSIKTRKNAANILRRIPLPRPGRSRLAARRDMPLARLPQFKINSWRVCAYQAVPAVGPMPAWRTPLGPLKGLETGELPPLAVRMWVGGERMMGCR
jgi:hypothetical protein